MVFPKTSWRKWFSKCPHFSIFHQISKIMKPKNILLDSDKLWLIDPKWSHEPNGPIWGSWVKKIEVAKNDLNAFLHNFQVIFNNFWPMTQNIYDKAKKVSGCAESPKTHVSYKNIITESDAARYNAGYHYCNGSYLFLMLNIKVAATQKLSIWNLLQMIIAAN